MSTTKKNTNSKKSISTNPKTSAPSNGCKAEGLDATPQLPSAEDIVLNLGFWFEMVQFAGKQIARERFTAKNDGLPKSEPNKE